MQILSESGHFGVVPRYVWDVPRGGAKTSQMELLKRLANISCIWIESSNSGKRPSRFLQVICIGSLLKCDFKAFITSISWLETDNSRKGARKLKKVVPHLNGNMILTSLLYSDVFLSQEQYNVTYLYDPYWTGCNYTAEIKPHHTSEHENSADLNALADTGADLWHKFTKYLIYQRFFNTFLFREISWNNGRSDLGFFRPQHATGWWICITLHWGREGQMHGSSGVADLINLLPWALFMKYSVMVKSAGNLSNKACSIHFLMDLLKATTV